MYIFELQLCDSWWFAHTFYIEIVFYPAFAQFERLRTPADMLNTCNVCLFCLSLSFVCPVFPSGV